MKQAHDSAMLKVDWAEEHISGLSKLVAEQHPFSYFLETNAKTGERFTFTKRNEAAIARAALICGDALHNLRSALDHAYWSIVARFVTLEHERRAIQFPFSETKARLDEVLKNRRANRVSPAFYKAILDLAPHGETDGNELIRMVHQLDVIDKHKLLVPVANYTRITSSIICKQVRDFPSNIFNCGSSMTYRDVVWRVDPRLLNRAELGRIKPPTTFIFEKKLDVPVEIVFPIGTPYHRKPMIPALHQATDTVREMIRLMRAAAAT